jgi:hypothetical protein
MDPVTLGDLIRNNRLIWVYCNDCCRERDIDPATLQLPQDTPVREVGKRLVCTECGGKRVETKPELYPSE